MPKQQKKKISKNKQQDIINPDTQPPAPAETSNDSESKNKKKTKYVNLYSQEGKNAQVVLLKGTLKTIVAIYHSNGKSIPI